MAGLRRPIHPAGFPCGAEFTGGQSNINAEIPHYLDFKFVLNQSEAGKKAQAALKKQLDDGIKSLKKNETSLQESEKKIIQQKKVLNPEEYKKKVTELRSKVANLQKEKCIVEPGIPGRSIDQNMHF